MSRKLAKKTHVASYQKPKLSKIRVSLNRFSSERFIDPEGALLLNYLAASPGCCLLPETHITLADRSYKKIEDIQVGDEVLSFDPNKNLFTTGKVANILAYTKKTGHFIINNKLKLTADHPVWIKNKQWVRAADLKKNNIMIDESGHEEKLANIRRVEKPVFVYDISIEGEVKSYFAEGYLTNTFIDQMHKQEAHLSSSSLVSFYPLQM